MYGVWCSKQGKVLHTIGPEKVSMYTQQIRCQQWCVTMVKFVSCYRSGTVNSNTVNSKFHLIRSFFEYLARFLSFHGLKCTVNSNTVNSKFH